ncbi:VTC domain-containing protein, partial [Virgibacillus salexigens]|uniref:VTC domain-containing protein n=1 Tax=Virgibacillus salexigens TaxID=61016 RepID=UPI003081CDCC
SEAEYHVLQDKLQHYLNRDTNGKRNGRYLIRSTYFDSVDNKVLQEKKEGYLNRDKYRDRIYGKSGKVIHLERKSKRNNLTYKTKCEISRSEFEKLRIGDIT